MAQRKNILCYGDSNTYGVIPRMYETDLPSERYGEDTRWPMVLAADLGEGHRVVEEGLGGRTTIYDWPDCPWRKGEPYLLPCILSHRPLDLVIMMLGTNDLHGVCNPPTPEHLGDGIRRLIGVIRSCPECGRGFQPPRILLLSPISIERPDPNGRVDVYGKFRGDIGRELSLRFPQVYSEIAGETGCEFLEAGKYACAGCDGVHFTANAHLRLGHAVAEKVRDILI